MPDGSGRHAIRPNEWVPPIVLETTRSLLRVETTADARRTAVELVRGLGGIVVPAGADDADAIPADVSFGDGPPLLPSAPSGSAARELIGLYLGPFLLDARHVLELYGRTERLVESASTDALTGLPNRRMLERALGRLLDQDTVIMLDLDYFKTVNDTFGHAAGDDVLRAFGRVLLSQIRDRDVVGRYGGEEFVVVLAPPAAQADAFLTRLRDEWATARPYPVTFSAGIARFSGDRDGVVERADEALYRAKDAGRDQWVWASDRPSSFREPRDYVAPYLEDAVAGKRRPAIRFALDLLDNHVPSEKILVDLLGAAQHEVGERWYRNELTSADEHVATGVAAATLDALAAESGARSRSGSIVVACAEGDWHSLAAQMFGEALCAHGFGVTVLGASTPADVVGDFLERNGSDALALSCTMPTFFAGTVGLVDAAHRVGVPVIIGGRALGDDARRAEQLGGDAWARTAGEAAPILAAWRIAPPPINGEPTPVDPVAMRLFAETDALARCASESLVAPLPRGAGIDDGNASQTRDDLQLIVQFLAAAVLVADPTVLSEFLIWFDELLVHRGVPPSTIVAELLALGPAVAAVDAGASRLLDSGRRHVLASSRGTAAVGQDDPA